MPFRVSGRTRIKNLIPSRSEDAESEMEKNISIGTNFREPSYSSLGALESRSGGKFTNGTVHQLSFVSHYAFANIP